MDHSQVQEEFVALLPYLERCLRRRFLFLRAEEFGELQADVVAVAWRLFVGRPDAYLAARIPGCFLWRDAIREYIRGMRVGRGHANRDLFNIVGAVAPVIAGKLPRRTSLGTADRARCRLARSEASGPAGEAIANYDFALFRCTLDTEECRVVAMALAGWTTTQIAWRVGRRCEAVAAMRRRLAEDWASHQGIAIG